MRAVEAPEVYGFAKFDDPGKRFQHAGLASRLWSVRPGRGAELRRFRAG